MPKITGIVPKPTRKRIWIYVDGQYCCSVRDRTFPALNLQIGQEISCQKIQDLENFHWKYSYGQAAWAKEKTRLERVKAFIEGIDPRIEARITGFGANSNLFIAEHPSESGRPDIEVISKQNTQPVLITVEVTGTESMRLGTTTYWVRPDKLKYARNHPEQDVWIILHYANPFECFVFIKPNKTKTYPVSKRDIRGSIEH